MVNAHGIVLAYDTRPELKELTQHRTLSSVPFGGKYRLIDFALSSLVNAGISDAGVVVRENYRSLLDHVGSGRDWDMNRKNGGLMVLPPFCYGQSMAGSAIRGPLDAMVGVSHYISAIREKYTVIMESDLVANVDLAAALEAHEKGGADITVVSTGEDLGGMDPTYITVDEQGRAVNVKVGGERGDCLQSMNIFILETALLRRIVANAEEQGQYDWVRDILQQRVRELKIGTFLHQGYCARISNVSEYYSHSMELLDRGVRKSVFRADRPVLTKVRDETSTYFSPESAVNKCLVADGCFVEGEVENSILFRGVRVEKGAVVKNSVLMQGTVVKAGAKVSYTIADKDVVISEGRELTGHSAYPFTISKGSKV